MILPTKGIPASKALITVGADVLEILGDASMSVSGLWLQLSEQRRTGVAARISYDWYILTLDMLYAIGAVQITHLGLIRRVQL